MQQWSASQLHTPTIIGSYFLRSHGCKRSLVIDNLCHGVLYLFDNPSRATYPICNHIGRRHEHSIEQQRQPLNASTNWQTSPILVPACDVSSSLRCLIQKALPLDPSPVLPTSVSSALKLKLQNASVINHQSTLLQMPLDLAKCPVFIYSSENGTECARNVIIRNTKEAVREPQYSCMLTY